jgi:hypothetical protein
VNFQPMSPDEIHRMMQFLLNQQPQFEANLAKGHERFEAEMEKLSAKTDRLADQLVGLTGIVAGVTSTVGAVTGIVSKLATLSNAPTSSSPGSIRCSSAICARITAVRPPEGSVSSERDWRSRRGDIRIRHSIPKAVALRWMTFV